MTSDGAQSRLRYSSSSRLNQHELSLEDKAFRTKVNLELSRFGIADSPLHYVITFRGTQQLLLLRPDLPGALRERIQILFESAYEEVSSDERLSETFFKGLPSK